MFNKELGINALLVALEGTLKLEVTDATVDEIIATAVQNLENSYNFTLDKDIFTLRDESIATTDNINKLLRNIKQSLAEASLFIQLKAFHKDLVISLADVNYLRYAKAQLMAALETLQDVDLYKEKGEEIVTPLYKVLNNISMCSVKRLFILLLMFHRIGVAEGVAIIASLLYMGGLNG